MRPSGRIRELAHVLHVTPTSPPTTWEYVEAIMDYLDEQESKSVLALTKEKP